MDEEITKKLSEINDSLRDIQSELLSTSGLRETLREIEKSVHAIRKDNHDHDGFRDGIFHKQVTESLWKLQDEIKALKLDELNASVRGGVYFLGAILILGFAAVYWK